MSSRPVAIATPSYSRVSDKLRRVSAGSLQCSLFCGGRGCKYESGGRWGEGDKALEGLFSHWVTPELLAMARPSSGLFQRRKLIEQFKSCGIGTVINLQLPWEHSKCGPGMESSGFTYHPEELMNHGVYFYNYGWMDYGVPTLESVLDMVRVVDFALRDGKVAIHCHAGLGRTGVLIACYLVYSQRLCGDQAIGAVREKRPGSIQTRPQIEIVQQFGRFIRPLWSFYPLAPSPSNTHPAPLTYEGYLHNQSLLLHGDEQEDLRYVTKVVHEVCSRLMKLAGTCHQQGSCDRNGPIALQSDDIVWDFDLPPSLQNRLEDIQHEMNTSLQWPLLSSETNSKVLLSLVFHYFRHLKEPFLSCEEVTALKEKCSMDVLSLAKKFTLEKVLDTLSLSLSHCDNHHRESLVRLVAGLLLQTSPQQWEEEESDGVRCVEESSEGVRGVEEGGDGVRGVVESLVHSHLSAMTATQSL